MTSHYAHLPDFQPVTAGSLTFAKKQCAEFWVWLLMPIATQRACQQRWKKTSQLQKCLLWTKQLSSDATRLTWCRGEVSRWCHPGGCRRLAQFSFRSSTLYWFLPLPHPVSHIYIYVYICIIHRIPPHPSPSQGVWGSKGLYLTF